jgi:pimeloyl-ACP methyl ester carboxylesterase
LHEGKARLAEINAPISHELGLLNFPTGDELDLSPTAAADSLCALNACLWRGCSASVRGNSLVLRLQDLPPESLCRRMSRMTRIITAEKHPQSTAVQARRWGLQLPQQLDPSKALIILIHRLDADRNNCIPIGELLHQQGFQTAYFSYPGDQPIDDSAALLAHSMGMLHDRFPHMQLSFVAHSMGGLVARDYVEGPNYLGHVQRLILVAPPNAGSSWAHLRPVLSAQENYYLRQGEPDWCWTWVITEGMGEAGSDLLPGSEFLLQLNRFPRRPGVRYTIIAGNKSDVSLVEANVVDSLSRWIPSFARTWWGIGRCYRGMQDKAERLRTGPDDSDGPVSLDSARLAGVSDFVVLAADHRSLYLSDAGKPPVAWAVINDRLRK